MRLGRASNPKSHWVYRAPEPRTQEKLKADGMIVEVRGNRLCTVFPGSVHVSGEAIAFDDRHDNCPGRRRGAIQSLSIGTTPRIGPLHGSQIGLAWMEYDDARVLIEAIATEAKDEELDDSF